MSESQLTSRCKYPGTGDRQTYLPLSIMHIPQYLNKCIFIIVFIKTLMNKMKLKISGYLHDNC